MLVKPSMVGSVNIKIMVWIQVDNNSYSVHISHLISAIWYIIKIISCNTPIDDVDSHTPDFYMFVLWYLSIP